MDMKTLLSYQKDTCKMEKNDSPLVPSLHRGNIALVLLIGILWFTHITYFNYQESASFPRVEPSKLSMVVGVVLLIGYFASYIGVGIFCKYLLPIAFTSFIGKLYLLSSERALFEIHIYSRGLYGTSDTYLGSRILHNLLTEGPCHSVLNPSVPQDLAEVSSFCNYWGAIIDYYVPYLEFMQQALFVSICISLIWWLRSHNLVDGIKYFWTKKAPGKNLRIILVFILAFTMSIPYWILFM